MNPTIKTLLPEQDVDSMPESALIAWVKTVLSNYPKDINILGEAHQHRKMVIEAGLKSFELRMISIGQFKESIKMSHDKSLQDSIERYILEQGKIDNARKSLHKDFDRYTSTDEHIAKFIGNKPIKAVNSKMVMDWITKTPDLEDSIISFVNNSDIFDFNWGFVSYLEQFNTWYFYAKEGWEKGENKYFDRFLMAWKNIGFRTLNEKLATLGKEYHLLMDDGRADRCSLVFACRQSDTLTKFAREWIGNTFLKNDWPDMLAKAMDPSYEFPVKWGLN